MNRFWLLLFILFSFSLYSQRSFVDNNPPDFSDLFYWSAHPDKESPAKLLPGKGEITQKELLDIDIFFIHPTTYSVKNPKTWNGELSNAFLNDLTDNRSIKYQASLFNQVGQIYAPRYRQAHISAYYLRDGANKTRIFDLAYGDVEKAFHHYMEYYNHGKAFIIASHSQGSTHGKRLVTELVDKHPKIREKMIVAYLVGMDVRVDEFENIPRCDFPEEVGCFTSWRTIREDVMPPDHYPKGDEYAVCNPLTWDIDQSYGDRDLHIGAVLKRFKKIHYHAINAEAKEGILYVCKPKVPFGFLSRIKNFHIADYNLFYYNVQSNARKRALVHQKLSR